MHHKDFEPSARNLVTTGHPITRGCAIGVVAPGFYILPHGMFLLWHHVPYRFSMSPWCYPCATLLFSIIPVCYVMVYTSPYHHANKQSILVMSLFVYSGKCWPSPCLKRATSTRLWGITPSENWILPGVTMSDET